MNLQKKIRWTDASICWFIFPLKTLQNGVLAPRSIKIVEKLPLSSLFCPSKLGKVWVLDVRVMHPQTAPPPRKVLSRHPEILILPEKLPLNPCVIWLGVDCPGPCLACSHVATAILGIAVRGPRCCSGTNAGPLVSLSPVAFNYDDGEPVAQMHKKCHLWKQTTVNSAISTGVVCCTLSLTYKHLVMVRTQGAGFKLGPWAISIIFALCCSWVVHFMLC